MAYTIKDVARQANVSIATVSRILNGQQGYSLKTKEKVMRIIEELGYHPNAVARGLINKRTHTIGVLFPHLSGSLVTDLLRGIEKAASARGSSIMVCHTESDKEKTMKYLHLLSEKRVDGLIFTSETLREEYYQFILKANIPVVLLSTKSDEYDVPYVKVDDYKAAYSATEYLIKKGHTNIGMISGRKEDLIAGKPRIDGFLDAMKDHQLQANDKHLYMANGFSFIDGIEGMKYFHKHTIGITAIFAASDEIAIGAMSTANQLGINIPEELSIIGYDNINFAEMSIPSLTTVAQPFTEMGEQAGKLLLSILENDEIPENQTVAHRIIERDSVQEK